MERHTGFSDLGDSIINDSGHGMADKRQLNLNHEYERRRGEKEATKREEEREQRKPRRQSGGSFVTVMASTPGLRPLRLAPLLVYR